MTEQNIPPGSAVQQPAPKPASEIAESILGPVDWMSPTEGYCDCPGRPRHANKNGRRDCAVYLDQVPTLHCVHQSCSAVVEATNKALRNAILNGAPVGTRRLTAEEKAQSKQRQDNERIRQRAAKALPQMLVEFAWPYADILAASPVKLEGREADHWRLLLGQFNPDDVVWIGDTFDSGKPAHAAHFKTAREWLAHNAAPGPYLCPVTFKNTSIARSNDNVVERRFIVVESDTLTRDQVGSVFRWLREACELKLVAIVDTAGKSLHGWFEFEADLLDDMKLVLPALQCDPKLFTPAQPVRLPGALRGNKYQKLVYLAKEVL